MAEQTLYRVLMVDPAATYAVIRAAYRELARTFHPDVDGDPESMKRINHAWSILGDPRRRAAYDEMLRSLPGQREAMPPAPAPARTWAPAASEEHAGPPPGHPSGPVMTYGRYEGWSLGEIARHDRRFLEWLRRMPAGRTMLNQIDAALREASYGTGLGGRPVVAAAVTSPATWSLGSRLAARR